MVVVCGWCGSDEFVAVDDATGLAVCTGNGHADTRLWDPPQTGSGTGPKQPRSLAERLDIAADLPACIIPGAWAETGVIEHRYRTLFPEKYALLVKELSGSQRPFESAYIGSRLGDLAREPGVAYREVQGTGYYHARVGSWTSEPIDAAAADLSWETYAHDLGLEATIRPSMQPTPATTRTKEPTMTDIRSTEPNDTGHRRARFHQGWNDAAASKPYTNEALSQLTWQNTGWRMGQIFADTSPDLIDEAYDWAVRQQAAANPN